MPKTGWGAALSNQPPAPAWNQHSSSNLVLTKLLPGLVASQEEEKYLFSSPPVSPQNHHCPPWLSALRVEIFLYYEYMGCRGKDALRIGPISGKCFSSFCLCVSLEAVQFVLLFSAQVASGLSWRFLSAPEATRQKCPREHKYFTNRMLQPCSSTQNTVQEVHMKCVLLQCAEATQPQPRRKLLNVQSTRCTS